MRICVPDVEHFFKNQLGIKPNQSPSSGDKLKPLTGTMNSHTPFPVSTQLEMEIASPVSARD
jgi:hypothetical protein